MSVYVSEYVIVCVCVCVCVCACLSVCVCLFYSLSSECVRARVRYKKTNFLTHWVLEGSPHAMRASAPTDWVVLVRARVG